jgi:hypothetical protein
VSESVADVKDVYKASVERFRKLLAGSAPLYVSVLPETVYCSSKSISISIVSDPPELLMTPNVVSESGIV